MNLKIIGYAINIVHYKDIKRFAEDQIGPQRLQDYDTCNSQVLRSLLTRLVVYHSCLRILVCIRERCPPSIERDLTALDFLPYDQMSIPLLFYEQRALLH